VEDSRTEVTDRSVAAEGFDFAVQDVFDAVVGTWVGELDEVGLTVDVDWDGAAIEAVLSHYEEPIVTGTGDPLPGGLPVMDCGPVYEVGFTLGVDGDPWLGAEGGARILVRSPTSLGIQIEVDESEVAGTIEPPEWDNPQFWDRTSLSAVFERREADVSLQLLWWAINDDPASSVGPGTGNVGTGTVEPSGITSPIGRAELTRVP
jgi:hypothetical protein